MPARALGRASTTPAAGCRWQRDPVTRRSLEQLHGTIDVSAARDAWDTALQQPAWQGYPTTSTATLALASQARRTLQAVLAE